MYIKSEIFDLDLCLWGNTGNPEHFRHLHTKDNNVQNMSLLHLKCWRYTSYIQVYVFLTLAYELKVKLLIPIIVCHLHTTGNQCAKFEYTPLNVRVVCTTSHTARFLVYLPMTFNPKIILAIWNMYCNLHALDKQCAKYESPTSCKISFEIQAVQT